ncbi:hypothetical protein BV20DRAFT_1126425 [Pilatotrama ljubarskyi]|nr:hypothetical protein BV20DRAFT_1126425 [Pilatotrama ljubarskyi]
MAASKRKFQDESTSAAGDANVHGYQHGSFTSESLAKHRRTASGSDFSTYDIKHALDMPATSHVPPPAPAPANPPEKRTPDLLELLDFSKLDTRKVISARFEELASRLLHDYRIEIASNGKTEQLEILELEFYLYKAGSHEDAFTHASDEQNQAGRWYFHRPPRRSNDPATQTAGPSGYRGGTRKGLDLTIGRPPQPLTSKYFSPSEPVNEASSSRTEPVLRGGILLRSVRRVSDSKVISGPSLLVDEILRLSGASEILELVAVNWDSDISAFPPTPPPSQRASTMWLRRVSSKAEPTPPENHSSTSKPRIFRSPRIGLDISNPSISPATALVHPRVVFISQTYRFFVNPHLLTVNGRGQTFLGVYDALEEHGNCENDEELIGELVRLTGVKAPTAMKYLSALRAGLQGGGGLEEWIGPKGKTVLSSITSWLKMMGTLRRLQTTPPLDIADASGAV